MAEGFKSSNLSVLAYANNFTLWHYTTIDLETEVEAANYFDSAVDMLRVNDLIITNIDTDGVSPVTNFYIVTSNDGTSVGITQFTG